MQKRLGSSSGHTVDISLPGNVKRTGLILLRLINKKKKSERIFKFELNTYISENLIVKLNEMINARFVNNYCVISCILSGNFLKVYSI